MIGLFAEQLIYLFEPGTEAVRSLYGRGLSSPRCTWQRVRHLDVEGANEQAHRARRRFELRKSTRRAHAV